MAGGEELEVYFDYESPFAYLAAEPTFALPERWAVRLRWLPFVLRLEGPGQRSVYSDWKARYSCVDARRFANRRGGFRIMGPPKIYDSVPALSRVPGWRRAEAARRVHRGGPRRPRVRSADLRPAGRALLGA